MFALSQLARPPAGSAGIDVLAPDAVATKELTAIFVPFVADTFFYPTDTCAAWSLGSSSKMCTIVPLVNA